MSRVLCTEIDDVRREVTIAAATAKKSDRLDLLLTRAGTAVAAVEVKVLSDLGLDQLTRYQSAFPNLEAYFVLHLASLPGTCGTRSRGDRWHGKTYSLPTRKASTYGLPRRRKRG